jgi:proteasome maturation protein
MEGKQLPIAHLPGDVLRYGLEARATQAGPKHPVEVIQFNRVEREFEGKLDTVRRIYGSGLAMRLKTEAAELSRPLRLPGLPSTLPGLETIMGKDETVDFEDFLGLPQESPEEPRFSVHEAMEIKYGLL